MKETLETEDDRADSIYFAQVEKERKENQKQEEIIVDLSGLAPAAAAVAIENNHKKKFLVPTITRENSEDSNKTEEMQLPC